MTSGGETIPTEAIKPPAIGGNYTLDENVVNALPIPGTRVISAHTYGMSLWGRTAKIVTRLPDGKIKVYFLKAVSGDLGCTMCEGEFESLKAIHAVSPTIAPEVYAWGEFRNRDSPTFFMLAEFRNVGEQPPDPVKFTMRLAEMHRNSSSPNGKFGFHVTTCHGKLTQVVDWEERWSVLYRNQLAHMIKLDEKNHKDWLEFQQISQLTLEKVIPKLLEPLQSDGRSIKPCLVQGDLWDENTATDMDTGEPFVFDAGSFYAHNEYETGNWRAPRHRLSNRSYIRNYKRHFPVSEPEEDWDARNLLYSLRFDLGTAILIPGCNQRTVVYNNMRTLCKLCCPEELTALRKHNENTLAHHKSRAREGQEEEEEEEEEEVEEEEEEEEEAKSGRNYEMEDRNASYGSDVSDDL